MTTTLTNTQWLTIAAASDLAKMADDLFEAALNRAGFKSRWDWNQFDKAQDPTGEVRHAYIRKVQADEIAHAAWERSRAS